MKVEDIKKEFDRLDEKYANDSQAIELIMDEYPILKQHVLKFGRDFSVCLTITSLLKKFLTIESSKEPDISNIVFNHLSDLKDDITYDDIAMLYILDVSYRDFDDRLIY